MANPLDIARTVLGKAEGPDRAALMDYLTTGGANLDPATTAWCAAFVNSTLEQAGMQGTGSNMARSFLGWGEEVDQPQPGDIGVWPRGDPNGPYGHVGFVESVDPRTGMVNLLGGNQGNAVSVQQRAMADALGFRRAAGGSLGPADGPKGQESYPTAAPPLPPPYAVADRPIGEPREQLAAAVAGPAAKKPATLAAALGKGLGGMATAYGNGAPPRRAPGGIPAARIDAPGETPTIDPASVEMQREMLAQALARLNSGRLV